MLHNDFRKCNLNYYADMTQHIRNLSLMTCFCLLQCICILTFNLVFSTFFSRKWSQSTPVLNLRNAACSVWFCTLPIPKSVSLCSLCPVASTLFQMPAELQRTLSAKPEADDNISLQLHKIDLIFMPFISSVLFFYLSPLFFPSLPCASIISPSVDFKEWWF